ncbi:NAD(P)H-dependent flavin oxidoreductase [Granulosicoccus antarcticus]|uniref:Propionate 3-nitronate monooxygenase n=1 Tax=Granulosicoccus antarcticus IMCC3135 TaxID=1192854 RepID=A0A2Z2NGY6_9GAMM|nr:nitronate monooxygenase [Granulosicoccus antarcticus]ASJ70556.1 Nitronate monooxygenase [Granulosicoccus antarcticus IMCC3135]
MSKIHASLKRANEFAERLGLRVPVLLAPMAGACPASLSIAVANAGGLGACGVLLMPPAGIEQWGRDFRAESTGLFQLNTWIPDPEPVRDAAHEAEINEFLSSWELEMGHEESVQSASATPPAPLVFSEQCDAMLEAAPVAISSIMGVYSEAMLAAMKSRGILWFATATTVTEAVIAANAGADVIVAQGMEAGGHRGSFKAADAEQSLVGLFSLLPAIVDVVDIPVVATGGIADARGAAAALLLGASAVQVGTGFLRAKESGISPSWADAIGQTLPEETVATRVFSGRLGRAIRTRYVDAATASQAPVPAPYPVQRGLTQAMRQAATRADNIDAIQAWAGQSAGMSKALPAADIVDDIWQGTQALLD